MKLFEIQKEENWTLCLLGHRLVEYCDHFLISFKLERMQEICHPHIELYKKPIKLDNVQECERSPYSVERMKQYLRSEPVEGFLYYTADTNEPVGCIWVMYKGGNELQYRVRHVDAFGFDFCVFPRFRGNGLIGVFIKDLLLHLKTKGIDTLYASVRRNNYSALKAYQKINMNVEKRKRFGRIRNFRIPYPVI